MTSTLRLLLFVLALSAAPARGNEYPIGTAETLDEGDNRIGAFRAWDRLFPARAVAAGKARDLPEGRRIILSGATEEFLARSGATGLIVLKDGEIRYENYWLGADRQSRFTSMSLAKSLISVLVGLALAEGAIASADDPVTLYLPELKGSGYDGVSIADALQMSSGAAFDEAPGSFADAWAFWQATAIRHDASALDWARKLSQAHEPGTAFKYSGVDTSVLGHVVARATGKSLADYASEKIWRAAGMEDDASWGLDGAGVELAYCCFNARLRDYARLGQFLMTEPSLTGWMGESTRPHRGQLAPGKLFAGYPLGYGYQWWLTEDGYMGHGAHGQFLLVMPEQRTVIVLVSAWQEYWDYGLEAEAYRAFAAIAKAMK